MKITALSNFYEKLLQDVGLVAKSDGKLSYLVGNTGTEKPVTVDGKRLTLPNRDVLKSLDHEHSIIFHPASEQLMCGPSPILEQLRQYITLRLTTTGVEIARAIAATAVDQSLHKKVGSKAKDIMVAMAVADDKTLHVLGQVLDKVGLSQDTRMYNLFMMASGTKSEPKGIRTTVVSFPIMDTAYDGDVDMFFGVKMLRKTKDKPSLLPLFEYLLDVKEPTEGVELKKEFTTLHTSAPYLNTLLSAFRSIAEHQNELIATFSKAFPALKGLEYNLDWTEEHDDFQEFVKKVGHSVILLPGNSGKVNKLDEPDAEVTVKVDADPKVKSWKDIRDSKALAEEEEVSIQIETGPKRRVAEVPDTVTASTWRDLAHRKQQRNNQGFGSRSREPVNNFASMAEDPRDRYEDPRGREGRGRGRYSAREDRYDRSRSRPSDQAPRSIHDVIGRNSTSRGGYR